MAVNRVDFGGNTLIDLTGDTLELPEQLLKGIIAHCKDGTPIEGTLEAGGGVTKMVTGSFTLASDTTGTIYIEQDVSSLALDGEDLDTTYGKLCFFVSLDLPENNRGTYGFAYFKINDKVGAGVSVGYDGSSTFYNAYSSTCRIGSTYGMMLKFGSQDAKIGLAGNTYKYYIWRARE